MTQERRPLFLVTNDDGYHAPGVQALRDQLATIGRAVIVAPDRELSGVGHAITIHHPLRIRKEAEDLYVVDGTPTDCVNLGVLKILGEKPDFVVSGVNCGANLGDDVTYSGTVAGAMEGSLLGVPSMALSVEVKRSTPDDERVTFHDAARIGAHLVRQFLGRPLPERSLLNVNVPGRKPLKGLVVTHQGRRNYTDSIVEKTDPRSQVYYWIGGEPVWSEEEGADQVMVARGYVSVTPITLDLTHREFMPDLARVVASLSLP